MRSRRPYLSRRLFSTAPALLAVAASIAGCGSSSTSSSSKSTSSAGATSANNSAGAAADNGVASKPAAGILAATKVAADSASSVHVSGTIKSASSALTLDMSLLAGKGGRGRISENGISFELIVIGNTVYINGSPAFYRRIGGSAAAELFQGKWLKASSSSADFASIASLTDIRKLVDTTLANPGKLSVGATTTVAGQKVVGVTDTTKHGTLYIATTGKPYPLQISKDGTGGGKINFGNWNAPVTLSAPANSVDVAQLQAHH
jgi:hypothetical protein